jgi:hypothetical protein
MIVFTGIYMSDSNEINSTTIEKQITAFNLKKWEEDIY